MATPANVPVSLSRGSINTDEFSKAPVCLVRGSINMDEFFKVPHIVRPGETISSAEYSQRPGGKGANQAVAVAVSGSTVEFAGSVGSDGAWLKEFLKERGVGTNLMLVHEDKPSGRAIIQTTPDGENAIFLFPGTNHASYPVDSPALRPYHTHLLLQNEILLSDTVETLNAAHQMGTVSIFNPSPMLSPEELRLFPWEKLSILVVNQGEASTLLDALGKQNDKLTDSEGRAILDALVALPVLSGLSGIVVTLGGSGAVASFLTPSGRETIQLPAAKVKVIDTTGAGDTFLGYLCGSLMRISGKTWELSELREALKRSIVAAGLSTERPGAMSSIPSNLEVESQLSAYHG
ncbi:ribokinase [Rhizoctonia solani AG-1 IB]|uniref:Ribokinase n=1 Tax=Thanatephorus cucumeris (strain AG1-IB / isolate 7/3/14) TaxID=1108050 RepID=A0A0B7G0I4_THACB|nr:ribokinase [Rhizoctonia solani AG-1 IB]